MNKMQKYLWLLFSLLITSCISANKNKNQLFFDYSQIKKIEVSEGFPATKIVMKNGFEQEFIKDLNKSIEIGPIKFPKTHRIILFYEKGEIDTILTNGTIYQFKGCHESSMNLIEKYTK